jgi:hypothetical protein
MNMMIYKKICKVYRIYSGDSNPKPTSQMCLIWSGDDPPDILENTEALIDLENELNFGIEEKDAVEIFNMNIEEATNYLERIIEEWEMKINKDGRV